MITTCPDCKGRGRKGSGFFFRSKKVCDTCEGTGRVGRVQLSDTRNTAYDGSTAAYFPPHTHHQPAEEFSGQGGKFGGAGASGNWDDSHSSSSSSNDSSSSSSDSSSSSSSSDGGGGGGGGGD